MEKRMKSMRRRGGGRGEGEEEEEVMAETGVNNPLSVERNARLARQEPGRRLSYDDLHTCTNLLQRRRRRRGLRQIECRLRLLLRILKRQCVTMAIATIKNTMRSEA